jgi:hypothetical protein
VKIDLATKAKKNNPDLSKIGEILGLLGEKGKTKDWLIEEIKKDTKDLKVSPTVNSFEILQSCSKKTIDRINKYLKDDEFAIQEIQTPTKTLHWFFTDIVGSSDPDMSTKAQARKINLLHMQIKKTEIFKNIDLNSTVVLPTGDGVALGFSESPEQPLRLAIELHKSLNKYNKIQREQDKVHIRIGIDSGPVYFIKDVLDKDTVWGPGIIMARRMMDLCGSDQIFTSKKIGDDVSNLSPEYMEILHPIGDFYIKHGQTEIYNVCGKNFGNKHAPTKTKVKPTGDDPLFPKGSNFEFNRVELHLDVIDVKTMMTHHTLIWDVRSNVEKPLEQIFYDIAGDTPKNFPDLNLVITDKDGNKLEIISLDVNKSHEKKFNVKLRKPLKKNQRQVLTLEYDWEEPYRVSEYVFSSICKKFRYEFTAPRELQVKNRILEVQRELGLKKRAEPPSTIKYLSKKTKISWETEKKHKINRFDAFEFQW